MGGRGGKASLKGKGGKCGGKGGEKHQWREKVGNVGGRGGKSIIDGKGGKCGWKRRDWVENRGQQNIQR